MAAEVFPQNKSDGTSPPNTHDGYCRFEINPCLSVKGCHNSKCRLGPPDPRWERVYVYVGPVQGYLYDPDTDDESADWPNYTEFLIEVPYEGIVWFSRQMINKKDIDLNRPEIFKFIMEEMISMVDGYMEAGGPIVG